MSATKSDEWYETRIAEIVEDAERRIEYGADFSEAVDAAIRHSTLVAEWDEQIAQAINHYGPDKNEDEYRKLKRHAKEQYGDDVDCVALSAIHRLNLAVGSALARRID